ncbi:MAG: hypothetical protein M4579_007352 [Chaenotheca gracillima]|nr:MAG: hypothetical protein M4579_007352 [Chaenotheca gracillima]
MSLQLAFTANNLDQLTRLENTVLNIQSILVVRQTVMNETAISHITEGANVDAEASCKSLETFSKRSSSNSAEPFGPRMRYRSNRLAYSTCKRVSDAGRTDSHEELIIQRHALRKTYQKSIASQQWGHYAAFLANVHHLSRTVDYQHVKDPDHPEDVVPDPYQETESLFAIFSPSWLSKAGIIISSRWSGQGWIPSIQIRPVSVRPIDALVFEFAASGNAAALQSLIRRGEASVSDVDEEGWTPLHFAANTMQLATCKLLAQTPGSKAMLNAYDTTPIHVLRFLPPGSDTSETLELVRVLVDVAGCDPFQEDAEGKSYFSRCISFRLTQQNLAIIRWLLRHHTFQQDPDEMNSRGFTFLIELMLSGHGREEDIDCLLRIGANINARSSFDDWNFPYWTALHCAVYGARQNLRAHIPLIKYLIRSGADLHALARTAETATDLIWIWHNDDPDNFLQWRDMLIDLGYDLLDFVEKEAEAHANSKWFHDNLCEEALLLNFGFVPNFEDPAVDALDTSHEYGNEDDNDYEWEGQEVDEWLQYDDEAASLASMKRLVTPLERAIYYGTRNLESWTESPEVCCPPRCYFKVDNSTARTVEWVTSRSEIALLLRWVTETQECPDSDTNRWKCERM